MPPILVGLGCFEVRRSPAIDVLYLHFRWLPLTYPPTKFISSQGNPYSSAKIARKSGKSLPKFSKKLTGEKPTFHLLPRYTSTRAHFPCGIIKATRQTKRLYSSGG
jgi:hypothetical protein